MKGVILLALSDHTLVPAWELDCSTSCQTSNGRRQGCQTPYPTHIRYLNNDTSDSPSLLQYHIQNQQFAKKQGKNKGINARLTKL